MKVVTDKKQRWLNEKQLCGPIIEYILHYILCMVIAME